MEHWLLRAAAMQPDRIAIETPEAVLSYRELAERARRAAGALVHRGISSGDRVGLTMPAGAEYAAAFHGCLLAGAVAMPIDLRLARQERAARLSSASLVVQEPLAGEPLERPAGMDLDAVATVMHTSGSTGAARPVALTFGNWLANALGSAVALGLDQAERWLCPMPLVHVGGLSILIRSAVYATTVVLRERFDAPEVATALADPARRITLVSLVPTMLGRLLDEGLREPPALRWALLGGGPIAPSLLERARVCGVPVMPTYGMTEACSQIVTGGWPLPGVEVRTAADGEVLVRGPNVAAGSLADDGWLHTGDLGSVDPDGRLRITGRKSEIIVTGGENVAPAEVEAVLLEHPAVADAAVHACASSEWGEAIAAKVVLRDSAKTAAEELRAYCGARLAAFKVPKTVEFVERLPRSETGKLLRGQL